MESPEALVDAVHLDAGAPSAALLVDNEPLESNQRAGFSECTAKVLVRLDVVRQVLREEVEGRDDVLDVAKPIKE